VSASASAEKWVHIFQVHLVPRFLPVLEISGEKGGKSHGQSPHRFLVKACSFYATHWVAKETCLLICNGKPLLIKENNQRAYSYLELRSRKPAGRAGMDR